MEWEPHSLNLTRPCSHWLWAPCPSHCEERPQLSLPRFSRRPSAHGPGRSHPAPREAATSGQASYLAGILASLQEASADHVVGDLSRVRGFTVGVTQQRGLQALQQFRVVDFEEQEEIKKRKMWVRMGRGMVTQG